VKIYYYPCIDFNDPNVASTPAHLFFGALKLPSKNVDVVYHAIQKQPSAWLDRITFSVVNAAVVFWRSFRCDCIYISTYSGLELLILLRALRVFRKPIVAIAYTQVKSSNSRFGLLFKLFYKGIDRMILSSKVNYDFAVAQNYFLAHQMVQVDPGPDLAFYDQIIQKKDSIASCGGFFASGREERDFDTLLDGFQGRSERLDIAVTPRHGIRDYAKYFEEKKYSLSENIHVNVLKTRLSPSEISLEAIRHDWMVCLVLPTNYNTGYTTIQEAAGLGMPIIATRNPYFGVDIEKEGIGFLIDYGDSQGLRDVLDRIEREPGLCLEMGRRARQYAQRHWNHDVFLEQLNGVFSGLVRQVG
jgi:glycosyltransferase involved in cell wall biosynthesis